MPKSKNSLQGLPGGDATGNGPVTAALTPPAEQESKGNAITPSKMDSTARPADGTDRYTPGAGTVLQIMLLPESIQSLLCMTGVQSKPQLVNNPAVCQGPVHATHTQSL